jgi:hypothetical protein
LSHKKKSPSLLLRQGSKGSPERLSAGYQRNLGCRLSFVHFQLLEYPEEYLSGYGGRFYLEFTKTSRIEHTPKTKVQENYPIQRSNIAGKSRI